METVVDRYGVSFIIPTFGVTRATTAHKSSARRVERGEQSRGIAGGTGYWILSIRQASREEQLYN